LINPFTGLYWKVVKLTLDVTHLDEHFVIEGGRSGNRHSNPTSRGRIVSFDLDPEADGSGGGVFFHKVDTRNDQPIGSYHAYIRHNRLMINTTTLEQQGQQFESISVSTDEEIRPHHER
jgi:hypothetical protein